MGLVAGRIHLGTQGQALRHAKAVLLIHDGEREMLKHHLVLNDGMRAHDQRGLPAFYEAQGFAALLGSLAASQPRHFQIQGLKQGFEQHNELAEMLLGQNFRWHHQRALLTRIHTDRRRQRRHDGFS